MISTRTDITDLMLQRILTSNTFNLNQAIEQLVSGSKLNHAKDNAANFSIATSLSTTISSMYVIQDNTLHGIDMLQNAESGLNSINNCFMQLHSLGVQASNGTYGETQRNALQLEANSIIEQIAQLRETVEYNGIKLLYTPQNEEITEPSVPSLLTFNNISNNILATYPDVSSDADISASEDFSLNSEDTNSLQTPKLMSPKSAPRLLGASPTPTTIEGAVDIDAGATKTIEIDGVSYTVQNRQTEMAQTLSYRKDPSTGQVTFLGSYFTITGQADVQHNIVVNGTYNYIYGGNLDDTLQEASSQGMYNRLYGGAGNDTLTIKSTGSRAYGQNGDDIITSSASYGAVDGGAGNDTFNISASYSSVSGGAGADTFNLTGGSNNTVNGGNDNDIFNISSNSNSLKGDAGDDIFNFIGTRKSNLVDGGTGTNTYTGSINNNTVANVVGGNAGSISLTANKTTAFEVNGISYTARSTSACTLMYTVTSTGEIQFSNTAGTATITGDSTVAHNVRLLSSSMVFNGGDLDDIIIAAAESSKAYGNGGNDTITASGQSSAAYGGDGNDNITLSGNITSGYGQNGNDTFSVSSNRTYTSGGEGDDTITFNGTYGLVDTGNGNDTVTLSSSANYSSVYSGDGNNTLINNTTGKILINGFGDSDNAEAIMTNSSEEKVIQINGQEYTARNSSEDIPLLYSYNKVTGVTTFAGRGTTITALGNEPHNVDLIGYSNKFNGGEGDDTITVHCYDATVHGMGGDDYIEKYVYSTLYGDDGNDTLIANASGHVYGGDGGDTITLNANMSIYTVNGGDGNDTYNLNAGSSIKTLLDTGGNNIYNINTNNSNITGSTGNDTFYVNGNNNTVLGGGGDDYFVINGTGNTIDGGTDTDNYIDNGGSTEISNSTVDPNSGAITLNSIDEVKVLELNGKTYTITNKKGVSNTLVYSLNTNTNVITLEGSDFEIDAKANEAAILNIKGNNNVVTGSNLADTIVIEAGNNNTVNGGSGNDIITMNSENNAINGDDGNDTIILNASTNKTITGNDGDDTIRVISNNNTNVTGGVGNDVIIVSGTNNTITDANGNNQITLNGSENTVMAKGNGANKVVVNSSNNGITLGNGDNSVGIQGDNNSISAGKVVGDINIYGNENTFSNTRGDNKVTIRGNSNSYSGTVGTKNVYINGNSNDILTTSGDDKFEIIGDYNSIETTAGNNDINIKGNNNSYIGGDDIDEIKINGDENNASGGDSSDEFMVYKGQNNIIDGGNGDRNTIINTGKYTTFTNVVDITPRPFESRIKVDTGTGDDKFIDINISFNLFDFSVDYSTAESAAKSLEEIDAMMNDIEEILVSIGANINRLESAAEAQQIKIANLTSQYSTIHDADVADVSSQYIKYQILQQASTTLMASSHGIQTNNVLGLIQNL